MNYLVPIIGLLTVIALSSLFIGCNATVPDERSSAEANVEAPTAESELIKKQDLILMPVSNTDRTIATTISGRVIPRNTTQLFAEVQGKIEPTKREQK